MVIGNRGSSGRIASRPAPYVGGDNLTPHKAAILLKLALTITSDRAEVQRIFNEYLGHLATALVAIPAPGSSPCLGGPYPSGLVRP